MFTADMLNTKGGLLGAEQSEEISHPEITPQKANHEDISDPGEIQEGQDFILL